MPASPVARPVVLVAWEPRSPEEALAVQEQIAPLARVEWIHELTSPLAAELLPQTVAVLVGAWPARLTQALSSMGRLRLVACVQETSDGLPLDNLQERGVRVVPGPAPAHTDGPVDPVRHVEWAREAAGRVADFLRRATKATS
jgi:hypothetical protein